MARYKKYTLNSVIDSLDLSSFDQRYLNDETGAPAYDPAILLKIILYAYSKGINSNRNIAALASQNIICMALAAEQQPHFTTIADFISSSSTQCVDLFTKVLAVCYSENLIGQQMFALIEKLRNKVIKITTWLDENEDRNESAKLATSHGVLQGYNGIVAVDEKHQTIVWAGVYGDSNE